MGDAFALRTFGISLFFGVAYFLTKRREKPKRTVTLISFDVDGTLCKSTSKTSNLLHKRAFIHAVRKLKPSIKHSEDELLDFITTQHGSTDGIVALSMLEYCGETYNHKTDIPKLFQYMNEFVVENSHVDFELTVIPGARELLLELQKRGDVFTGLVTGNLELIGWAKMKALGIKHLFSEPKSGGFGSDHCSGDISRKMEDRGEQIRIFLRKCEEIFGSNFEFRQYHIGDTTYDMNAAEYAGAIAVGVATGGHTVEKLQGCATNKSSRVLENLMDLKRALQAFDLSHDSIRETEL